MTTIVVPVITGHDVLGAHLLCRRQLARETTDPNGTAHHKFHLKAAIKKVKSI
jgi:hypothetical protein